jgi:quercetin dioxygenase-like cupin family protein
MKRRVFLMTALALLAVAAFAAVTMASPPSGVTPTILARGTFNSFNVSPDSQESDDSRDKSQARHDDVPHPPVINFRARSKSPVDLVVRRHDYLPHSSTGWHSHPGPVFITVTQGQLTFYESGDPTCTPHVVSAGQGYVDTGHGHIGRNETDQPAQDVSVIVAPVGGAFRGELPAPDPHCGF